MTKHKFYLLADKRDHPIKVMDTLQKWIGEIADFELGTICTTDWAASVKKMAKIREIAEGLSSDENNDYIVYIKEVNIE